MALLNSFNTGVAGIKTFSKSLEVIGDNIANVNTTGFKSSRVSNQDNFSMTLQEGLAPATPAGSLNPMQVGNGSSVGSISQKFTQGVLSTTGSPTDLGITGGAFFKITGHPDGTMYTRAGDFRLDTSGNLVTSEGYKVDGATTISNVDSFKIAKDGTITTYKNGIAGSGGKINLVTFANPNGLKREGANLLSNLNGAAGAESAAVAGTSEIIQGTLELSNVDLTQEFSDLIVAQRAFQSNSRVITVSDSVMEEVVNLKR
jgi:flagellar hook protein FlgE